MFKKWFTKRDKNSSPDSNSDYQDMTSLKAYIVLGCDQNDESFVAVQFSSGEQYRMAELLYLLVSGEMVEETVKSLRLACEDEVEAKKILQTLAGLMQQHVQQNTTQSRTSGPVVSPTEVFSKRDSNDFKG